MKKILSLFEFLLLIIGMILIISSFLIFKNDNYLYLIGSLIGITALIFVSKGNPIGQLLTIIFSVFYGIISYSFSYYGEMITYLLMTTPIAIAALISWIKNPYKGNKSEVKVNEISSKEWLILGIIALVITFSFYLILKWLNTPNLFVSTISILTSFLASYLTFRRSRFYAFFYALNDVVLITLWVLASIEEFTYLPMVICFVIFFVNDIYGFINWSKMLNKQNKNL